MAAAGVEDGFQPDPTGRHQERFWTGGGWTGRVRDGDQEAFDAYRLEPVARSGPPPLVPPQGVAAWLRVVGLLAGYVALSSLLGLLPAAVAMPFYGPAPETWPGGPLATIAYAWFLSAPGDLLFVVGLVAAGVLATLAGGFRSILIAGGLTWLTYALAAAVSLPIGFLGEGETTVGAGNLVVTLPAAPVFGFLGLAFSALAPLAARSLLSRQAGAAS